MIAIMQLPDRFSDIGHVANVCSRRLSPSMAAALWAKSHFRRLGPTPAGRRRGGIVKKRFTRPRCPELYRKMYRCDCNIDTSSIDPADVDA
jgi:hypothetical protein